MRDHELELIAALVEGRLEDETEARALIASSTEAREEYETQKLAYESLRAMGMARLSEDEKAALHRDVWTDLRAGVPTHETRRPWYYRWVPVAAGLFLLVGLAAVLTGGEQQAAETLTGLGQADSGAAETTSTAAASAEAEGGEDTASDEPAATFSEESAGDGDDEEAESSYAADAARVRERAFTARLQQFEGDDDQDVEACLEQAGLIEYRPAATLIPPDQPVSDPETTLVIAAPEDSDLTQAPLVFVDLTTCDVVYRDISPD